MFHFLPFEDIDSFRGSMGVPLDWESGPLAEGLACYRRGEFFAAHEHWEIVWLTLSEPEKSFLQALIQLTAAFHHVNKSNLVGAAALLRNASRRLQRCPAYFGGIGVTGLCAEISGWLRAIEDGTQPAPAEPPQIRPTDPAPALSHP